ncbi:hypothetical protein T09_13858 [Trichinella sp. T9]|nr:hypothetical protein T09_13858 [Trichinella sp. T9]
MSKSSSSCSLVSCAVSSCAYDFNPTKCNRGNIHDSPRRPPVGEIDSRVAHKPSHLELPSTPEWTRLKLVPKRFKCSMSPSDFGCGFSISCDSVVRHRLLPFHLRKSQPRYASWTLLSPVTTNLEAPLQERLCLEEPILAEPELYVPLHTAHTGHTWLLFVNPTVRETVGRNRTPNRQSNQFIARLQYTSGVRNLRIERAAKNVQPAMNDAKLNKFLGKQNISSYAPHSMLLKLAVVGLTCSCCDLKDAECGLQ